MGGVAGLPSPILRSAAPTQPLQPGSSLALAQEAALFAPRLADLGSYEVLQWNGENWGAAQALPDDLHLPLSRDYSTVSLPSPLIMGAIGLASIVILRRRKSANVSTAN
jgi:hypothetical protein